MNQLLFDSDPVFLKNLVGQTVSVQTVDDQCYVGAVYVVDPIFKTVVLINKETKRLQFLLYHAIKSFNILSNGENHELLQQNGSHHEQLDEVAINNKRKLIKWLQHMFLDVKEDGDLLRVEDHLCIGAPYGRNDCMCDNTIVLQRVQNIIDLMPTDFK